MFDDASALVAILYSEAGYLALADRLRSPERSITSAFAVCETVLALCRTGGVSVDDGETEVLRFLTSARSAIVPIAAEESRAMLLADARFGKGRGHPAQLNLGDCFAYACDRTHGVPALFVGKGFAQTDIRSAMA